MKNRGHLSSIFVLGHLKENMNLQEISTRAPEQLEKESIKLINDQMIEKLAEYQRLMYAQGRHSLLIILQGMDASGKDGAVRKIFKGVNPLGCNVQPFKKPTEEELAHDFLWRVHKHVPAKGMIQIFNRSHYEDILVPSVEGLFSDDIVEQRYQLINDFEKLIQHNGTHILKFYLHVSYEEQYERLIERINLPHKHWKHNDGDWSSRAKWDKYQEVYEGIFKKCNHVPWHIIPSDQNWYKVNCILKEILKTFRGMELDWPDLDSDLFTPDYNEED